MSFHTIWYWVNTAFLPISLKDLLLTTVRLQFIIFFFNCKSMFLILVSSLWHSVLLYKLFSQNGAPYGNILKIKSEKTLDSECFMSWRLTGK